MDSIEPDTPLPRSQQPPQAPREPPVSGRMASPERESAPAASGLLGRVQKLWDVDTEDVKTRCVVALNPLLRTPFLTNGAVDAAPGTIAYGKWPDMWGPVWILYTVVLAMFMSATLAGMYAAYFSKDSGRYNYDVAILTGGAVLMSVYTFAVPAGVWLVVQFFNLVPSLTLAQTISLYGYSNTLWVPLVLVLGSPLTCVPLVGYAVATTVRWVVSGIGFALTSWFIFGNLFRVIFQHASETVTVDRPKGMLVIAAGVILHAVLALLVSFTFSIAVGQQ